MGELVTLPKLLSLRAQWRFFRRNVVFTNGCFDILHRGHIDYLEKAKSLGDVLVVGLNDDASVTRLKGPQRPIVGQEDRARILVALKCVDYVCMFSEDTPFELISSVVPDTLVKGADWPIDKVVGKDVVEAAGGSVRTIEFVPNRSTSGIIEKIAHAVRK
jgi:rfaE bifunctional protein nucleotidyltransferase chain/domain